MAKNTLLIQFSPQSFVIIEMYIKNTGFAVDFKFDYCHMTSLLFCHSGSSPNGHSCKRRALLATTFTKPRFSQLPYKLCIFHSSKRPAAPVTFTFFVPQGCPLKRTSTVCYTALFQKSTISFPFQFLV